MERFGTFWNILGHIGTFPLLEIRKGLSSAEAYQDKLHDRSINQIGRQKAKSGLYKDSREACYPYRVDGINEKY